MAVNPDTIINLSGANVALVDANNQGLDIMAQIFTGFGVRNLIRCSSAHEAQELLSRKTVDLLVTEASLPEIDGFELVRWLRQSDLKPNAQTQVMVVTGHTPMRKVLQARDCGANAVVAKPLRTQILLDRVFWLAKDSRNFIVSPTYTGPDRRWRNMGPPPGGKGRRSTDLSAQLGEARDPNMDQSDIDAFFKPMKISI